MNYSILLKQRNVQKKINKIIKFKTKSIKKNLNKRQFKKKYSTANLASVQKRKTIVFSFFSFVNQYEYFTK